MSIARGGLGNDVIIGSKGPDIIYGSPKRVPRGRPTATRSVAWAATIGSTTTEVPATCCSVSAASTGSTPWGERFLRSFGGNGSDFLYSDGGRTASGKEEKLFGERGNDRLNANQGRSNGPAFLDAGSGDDWIKGTSFADTVVLNAGIVKVETGAGNDLIVSTSAGNATVNGRSGT